MITNLNEFKKSLNEAIKSSNYDFAESFAKKNGISYYTRVNEYTKLDEVVFYGSAADFFKQKNFSKFMQITEPDGFDKNSTRRVNIGIAIYTGNVDKMKNEISTSILYDVNYKPGMKIY
jgi:hypothetical protein